MVWVSARGPALAYSARKAVSRRCVESNDGGAGVVKRFRADHRARPRPLAGSDDPFARAFIAPEVTYATRDRRSDGSSIEKSNPETVGRRFLPRRELRPHLRGDSLIKLPFEDRRGLPEDPSRDCLLTKIRLEKSANIALPMPRLFFFSIPLTAGNRFLLLILLFLENHSRFRSRGIDLLRRPSLPFLVSSLRSLFTPSCSVRRAEYVKRRATLDEGSGGARRT